MILRVKLNFFIFSFLHFSSFFIFLRVSFFFIFSSFFNFFFFFFSGLLEIRFFFASIASRLLVPFRVKKIMFLSVSGGSSLGPLFLLCVCTLHTSARAKLTANSSEISHFLNCSSFFFIFQSFSSLFFFCSSIFIFLIFLFFFFFLSRQITPLVNTWFAKPWTQGLAHQQKAFFVAAFLPSHGLGHMQAPSPLQMAHGSQSAEVLELQVQLEASRDVFTI